MDPTIFPWITGAGGALVVLSVIAWAFFTGRLHSDREFNKLERAYEALEAENDQLREAREVERRTADEAASAARVTDKLLAALTSLAMERHQIAQGDATAKDTSL